MSWRKEDREYDRMQEGFYVTKIEKRIRDLEADKKTLMIALELIAQSECPPSCKSCEKQCDACIAKEALKEME